MGGRIDFGIESLNREGQAHRRYRRITNILSHPQKELCKRTQKVTPQAHNMYGHRRMLGLPFVGRQHALRGADLVSEFHLRVPRLRLLIRVCPRIVKVI